MDLHEEVNINVASYQWSVRIFSMLKKLLSVNIRLHHNQGQVATGEIFLFNHFARFETFIPQYLIYQETGAFCRAVAAADFFAKDDAFANYLLGVGAVPNNHERLIPYLASEIIRGRKVVIFPEGGMVKNRRILDEKGRYRVYSRSAREFRKHHTGAAALALTVELIKHSVHQAFTDKDSKRIEKWTRHFGFEESGRLFDAIQSPSTIVPANITFYPMRVGDNLLHRGVELFNRGINKRLSEELLIEGNILLKDTDMDIRLGDAIFAENYWSRWEQPLLKYLVTRIDSPDQLTSEQPSGLDLGNRFLAARVRHHAQRIRDRYMREIYDQVTVNLSHLASQIIYQYLDMGRMSITQTLFHRTLYLAVKNAQKIPRIQLHRSLKNPEAYEGLLEGNCNGLDQFFRTASQLELIELEDGQYHFLPKLCEDHDFDMIRLENMVEVYANEVQAINGIESVVSQAISTAETIAHDALARLRFHDQLQAYHWDRFYYQKPRFKEINDRETASQSGEPLLLIPDQVKSTGILLTHGFLASPAEVQGFAQRLHELGYTVIAPRLKGHGTSPWDLRERSWNDWLDSVRKSYRILGCLCDQICMVGFSTGGALSLLLASEQPDGLLGTVAISVPVKFKNKNMIFVPLAHHANRLVQWLPTYEGIIPFRSNNTEHPDINYQSIPVHALFELRVMINQMLKRLKDVHCPTLLLQADQDPVVVPQSAKIIHRKLTHADTRLETIQAQRHGILHNDLDGTWQSVIRYIQDLENTGKSEEYLSHAECGVRKLLG